MVLNMGNTTYNIDLGQLDLQQQARQAMERMVRELRQATAGSVSISGEVITFNTSAASGVQFYRNPEQNQAMREYPVGTQNILGNYISSLGFCCWHDTPSPGICDYNCTGSNLVEITLTASNTVFGRNLSFALKEQVNLRNE